MNRRRSLLCTALGIAALWGSTAAASTVSFDSVPIPTVFGGDAGQAPGQVVLVEDDIAMSVEEYFLDETVGFIRADVGGLNAGAFPSPPGLELDNISVKFDFTGLPFAVTNVVLDYYEFGHGLGNNFSVNNQPVIVLDSILELPINIAPGVSAIVTESTIALAGPIDSLLIGGQELGLDNIVAVPEPVPALLLVIGGLIVVLRRFGRRTIA